jgi:hypothetical protein
VPRILQFAHNNAPSAALWLLWAAWVAWFLSGWGQRRGSLSVVVGLPLERVRVLLAALAGSNLFFVLTTWGWIALYRTWHGDWDAAPMIKFLVVQLSLATENTLATWYSAMLMLAVSAMAILCCCLDARYREPGYRRFLTTGWMAASLLFAFLSFDEIGSFHERVDVVDSVRRLGGFSAAWDIVLVAIGLAVLVLGVAWCFLQFRGARWPLAFLVLGVLLIGGVVGFERIEDDLWQPGAGQTKLDKPVSLTLFEEGSELFAFWSFLAAFAGYAAIRIRDALARTVPAGRQALHGLPLTFDLYRSVRWTLTVLFALAVGFAAVKLSGLQFIEGDNGVPQSWFVSAPAACAAALSAWLYRTAAKRHCPYGALYGLVAVHCLALSAYYGANAKGWLVMESLLAYHVQALANGLLIAATAALGALLSFRADDAWSRFGAGAWAILLVLALSGFGPSGVAGTLELCAFLFLLPSLRSHLHRDGQEVADVDPSVVQA